MPTPLQDLYAANEKLDAAAIAAALKAGADPNGSNHPHSNPLTHLASQGTNHARNLAKKLESFNVLIGAGASVDSKSHFGSALSWAAGSGDLASTRYLLSLKADPDIQGDGGNRPAHWCARSASEIEGLRKHKTNVLACLRELLLAGADPFGCNQLRNGYLTTAFNLWGHGRAKEARIECAALLLASQGVEIQHDTAICPLVEKQHCVLATRFLDHYKMPRSERLGWSSDPIVDLDPANVSKIQDFLAARY